MSVTLVSLNGPGPVPDADELAVDFPRSLAATPCERIFSGDAGEEAYLECLQESLLSGKAILLRYRADDRISARAAERLRKKLEWEGQSSHPRIISTVDVAVLTCEAGELKVGLTRRAKYPHYGMEALPGGFIHLDRDASTRDAALRIVRLFGVVDCHLEQVETISGPGRDIRGQNGWAMSVLHMAVIHPEDMVRTTLDFQPVRSMGNLAFDHADMLDRAARRFREKARYTSLLARALPMEFQMNAFIDACRSVTGAHVDQASLRRKVAELGMLRQVGVAPGKGAPAIMSLAAPGVEIYPRPFI